MADTLHPCDDPDCISVHGRRANGNRILYHRHDATTASKDAERGGCAELPVFAYDKPNATRAAAKQYYCMSLLELIATLNDMPQGDWCFYEVTIPDRPCRVYLDAEADLTINPDFDGDAAHEMIVREFTAWLAEHVCPRFADPQSFRWVVLDASSKDKWSRHYIGVGECMSNPFHVGAAVRRFEQYCIDRHGMASAWFVNKKHKLNHEPHRTCILDNTVYTEYRVYRMVCQRKRGSARVMLPCPGMQLCVAPIKPRLFYDTMVQPPHLRRTVASEHAAHICMEADDSEPHSMTNAMGTCSRAMIEARRRLAPRERRDVPYASTGPAKRCPLELYAFAQKAVLELVGQTISGYNAAKFYPDEETVVVPTNETFCHIKQDHHHGEGGVPLSHAYYCVNLSTRMVAQKCFSPFCIARLRQRNAWKLVTWSLSPDLVRDLDALLERLVLPGARNNGYVSVDDVMDVIARATARTHRRSNAK